MEVSKQSKLTFHGVDFINVNFIAFAPRGEEVKIDIKCEPKVFYPENELNIFKIILDITLKDERFFELSTKAVGTFEVEAELDEELKKIFVNSNSLAIMFPYVRSFISTFTANLGNSINTLIIPTQFFKGELEEIN